jgi:glutathione synthase/RimK-type ligase-like ATP-grasp enzyme
MKPVVLSEDIEKKTIELLKKLRVRFASCDFLRDVKDNIYFLEANVQGNWLWTETDDFHISRAIAKALTTGASFRHFGGEFVGAPPFQAG